MYLISILKNPAVLEHANCANTEGGSSTQVIHSYYQLLQYVTFLESNDSVYRPVCDLKPTNQGLKFGHRLKNAGPSDLPE